MPTSTDTTDEDDEVRVRRNTDVWSEQKEWVMEQDLKMWETSMQTVVESFTAGVEFDEVQLELQPSGKTFTAVVAETAEQRAVGMSGRAWSEDLQAMLFMLPTGVQATFAASNSPALSIGFFDADGQLLGLDRLSAEKEDTRTVVQAVGAVWALEWDPEQIPAEAFDGQRLVVTTST